MRRSALNDTINGINMNQTLLTLCAVAFAGNLSIATAADGMDPLARTKSGEMSNPSSMGMAHGEGMSNSSASHMTGMDSNHDGMISKQEFMTSHESHYDSYKKNSSGMVNMNEMDHSGSPGDKKGLQGNTAE